MFIYQECINKKLYKYNFSFAALQDARQKMPLILIEQLNNDRGQ